MEGVKSEQRTKRACSLIELLRYATKSKGEIPLLELLRFATKSKGEIPLLEVESANHPLLRCKLER